MQPFFSEEDARNLIAKIAANNAGESVVFSPIMPRTIRLAILQELAAALRQNTTLKKIAFPAFEFGLLQSEDFEALTSILAENKTLECVDLTGNCLTDLQMVPLVAVLQKNHTLIELNLEGQHIRDEGATLLANALTNHPSLKKLSLKGNNISDEGAKAIADMLEKNTRLESLDLAANHITNYGAILIAMSLTKNSVLREISLGSSYWSYILIEDSAAKEFAATLKVNHTLQSLSFTLTRIGQIGGQAIADALIANNTLKHLGFNDACSTPECLEEIARGLGQNRGLETLEICGYVDIQESFYKLLTTALEKNQTLKTLNLSNSSRGGLAEIKALAKGLAKNRSLETLNLQGMTTAVPDKYVASLLIDNGLNENLTLTSLLGVNDERCNAILQRNIDKKLWEKPRKFAKLVKDLWFHATLNEIKMATLVELRNELSEKYKDDQQSAPMRLFAICDSVLSYLEEGSLKDLLLKALDLLELRQFSLSIFDNFDSFKNFAETRLDVNQLKPGQIVFIQERKDEKLSSQYVIKELILKDHHGSIKKIDVNGLRVLDLINVTRLIRRNRNKSIDRMNPDDLIIFNQLGCKGDLNYLKNNIEKIDLTAEIRDTLKAIYHLTKNIEGLRLTTDMLVAFQDKILFALHARKIIDQFNRESEGMAFLAEVIHCALITDPLFIAKYHEPSADLLTLRNCILWWFCGIQLGQFYYANDERCDLFFPRQKEDLVMLAKSLGHAVDNFSSYPTEIIKRTTTKNNDTESARLLRESQLGLHPPVATTATEQTSSTPQHCPVTNNQS